MHPHAALIMSFYEAFRLRDSKGMSALPASLLFYPPILHSGGVCAATRCARCGRCSAITLKGRHRQLLRTSSPTTASDEPIGMPTTPSRGTGRPVHNSITAGFAFKDGLIARHADRLASFWRWSRQSLGPVGLLGWGGRRSRSQGPRRRPRRAAGLGSAMEGRTTAAICTAPSRDARVNTTAGDRGQVRLKGTWQRRSG